MSEETKQEATTPETAANQEAKTSTDAPARPAGEPTRPADDPATSAETKTAAEGAPGAAPRGNGRGGRRNQGGDRRNPRRPRRGGRREGRERQEFDSKIISVRRVTRVMAGGRRFSFSVAMVIGDKKGRVGVGIGKASDTQLAREKAMRDARKHMITVPLNKDGHIPHDVHTKYASSEVMIMPAPGRGIVAGSSVRIVLELAGVKDVTAKIFSRSKNKLNNAKAALAALTLLKS